MPATEARGTPKPCRRPRPRRATPRPGPTPRQRFEDAMLATLIEEVHDRGGPCLLCGAPARNVGVWRPIRRLARYVGCPEGKDRLLVYALCDLCLDAPIGRVERALLDLRRAELAAGAAGLEIAGGLVHFSTAEDRRRFAAAYERWAPPAYYTLRGQ